MSRCGFISFYNSDTNYNGTVTVTTFGCSSVKQISGEMPYSDYSFNKYTLNLLNRSVRRGSELPYTVLVELVRIAIRLDKINEFPVRFSFSFNPDGKPVVCVHNVEKHIFPLPFKNIGYMQNFVYADATRWLFGSYLTDNLSVSVACDILNNVAVYNGIIDNKLFECSCGRLFVNASFASLSLVGRNILKEITNYNLLSKCFSILPSKIRINSRNNNIEFNNNIFYANKILELHTNAVRNACKQSLLYYISEPKYLHSAVSEEVVQIISSFTSYCRHIPGVAPKDFAYLGLFDILKAYSDADFRYNLSEYVAVKRKIYNANKLRNINYFKSDGTLY